MKIFIYIYIYIYVCILGGKLTKPDKGWVPVMLPPRENKDKDKDAKDNAVDKGSDDKEHKPSSSGDNRDNPNHSNNSSTTTTTPELSDNNNVNGHVTPVASPLIGAISVTDLINNGLGGEEKKVIKKKRKRPDQHWMSIEDPFEVTHDLGRLVDRKALYHVRGELMRAFNLLTRQGNVGELFQGIAEGKGFREERKGKPPGPAGREEEKKK